MRNEQFNYLVVFSFKKNTGEELSVTVTK